MLKRLTVVVLVLAIVGVASGQPATAHSFKPFSAGTCTELSLPVALSATSPQDQVVKGKICRPFHWSSFGRRLDILTHGATYNRYYWDLPGFGPQYSFVQQTLLAGRAVLAYDVLGSGASSHPLSTSLDVTTNAFVLHQIIVWAKSKDYAEVNSVGHSLGSAIAIQEAATYNDVSRLVVTGWFHAAGPGGAILAANTYAATLDPKFAGQPLDDGYQTTRPGIRGTVFYYAPGSDPSVITADETNKDLVAASLRTSAIAQRSAPAASNVSNQVKAPVLTIAGAHDDLLCGAVLDCTSLSAAVANETPFYTQSSSLTTRVIPFTGHDLALHYTAPLSFFTIDRWIRTTTALN